MSRSGLRIAIDGPSGAGKSTLARALAQELGLRYVDTGAMYRAVAWSAMQAGAESPQEVVAMLSRIELEIDPDPERFRVRVGGVDVTEQLRDPVVGKRASEVAQIPAVRTWLMEAQRAEAGDGAVLEGRDSGTVVLRDADVKIFITAPEHVRMQRRAAQLGNPEVEQVEADIRQRDRRDRQRRASPLRAADDAVIIDTGFEEPAASLRRILDVVAARPR